MTTWGAYATGTSGRKFRVGHNFDVVWETDSQIRLRLRQPFYGSYGVNDSSNTDSVTGDFSRSGSVSVVASFNTEVELWSQEVTFDKVYGATSLASFAMSLSGLDVYGTGTTATHSGSYVIAARPYALPAAPTGCGATRVSDTQQTVAWTNTSPGSSSAPYQQMQVRRRDNVNTAWVTIAASLGVVTSYTDATTVADRAYEYAVRAGNSTGWSAWVAASIIKTTPAAPSSVAAAKSGSDIVVTWADNSTAEDGFTVEKQENGGAWTAAATPAAGSTSWTHTAPAAGSTWKYRVKSTTATPALASAWVESNTVQLAAAPNAPTGIAPTAIRDATDAVTFTWVHNPVDTSPQSAFKIRHRTTGGGWTTVTVDTGPAALLSQYTLAGGTYANPLTVELEIATKGLHADYSPWSSTASAPTSTRPTATISDPPDGGVLDTSTALATWAYYDAEGSAQAEWEARLLDSTAVVVETRSGVGTATSTTFVTPVADGGSYTIEVRVRDGAGMWSLWDSVDFDVAYLPPEDVTLLAVYDDASGAMVLTLTPEGAVTDVSVDAVSVDVERSIDGGPWRQVARDLEPDAVALDMIPATRGNNSYRLIVWSALPSSATMTPVDVAVDESRWAFLNNGPGFGSVAKFYGNLRLKSTAGIEEAVEYFAGRDDPDEGGGPVLLTGDQRSRSVGVAATLDADSSTRDDLEEAAQRGGVACYRDPSGRRMFARFHPTDLAQEGPSLTEVTISLTEVGYAG